MEQPDAVATFKDTVIANSRGWVYYSFNDGMTWEKHRGPGISPVQKLIILPNGLRVCLVPNYGLKHYQRMTDQWHILTGSPGAAYYYTAEGLRDGSILLASSKGIHHVKDTSIWLDVTSGFALNDSNNYYPITRFIEDPKNKIYYAATLGAGVWKSASVLQSAGDAQEPLQFSISPNPFTTRTTIHFTEANPSWSEIELRNILGVVVWKQGREYSAAGMNTLPIEVSGLPPGNYLLVLRTHERTETQWVTIVK